MAHWRNNIEIVSCRLDNQRYITLTSIRSNQWRFQVLGPEPLTTVFEDLTLQESLSYAQSVVTDYFRRVNPSVRVPSFLPWCAAVAVRKWIAD